MTAADPYTAAQQAKLRQLYPDGYPREKSLACGMKEGLGGTATCIIDNPHRGRPHWGPDRDGNYRQFERK